ncbi:MAG: hypothetical protein ACREBR_04910 [bacterium]
MNFCGITLKINEFPSEDVKKWGIEKVKDLIAYKEHIDKCLNCQAVMDELLERHKDAPRRIDPTSLN